MIDNVALIKRLLAQIEFLERIASSLRSSLCLKPANEEIKDVVRDLRIKMCERGAKTIAVQRASVSKFYKWGGNLLIL